MADQSNDIVVKGEIPIIVGAALGFLCSVWGVRVETFAATAGPAAGAIALTFAVLLIASWFKYDPVTGQDYSGRVIKLFLQVWAGTISFLLVGVVTIAVNWVLFRIPGRYSNWISLAIVPIGYFAHRFKQRNLLRYGMVEVLVGFSTALGATTKGGFQPTQGLGVIGATYVVARGFSNISDARKKAAEASGTK